MHVRSGGNVAKPGSTRGGLAVKSATRFPILLGHRLANVHMHRCRSELSSRVCTTVLVRRVRQFHWHISFGAQLENFASSVIRKTHQPQPRLKLHRMSETSETTTMDSSVEQSIDRVLRPEAHMWATGDTSSGSPLSHELSLIIRQILLELRKGVPCGGVVVTNDPRMLNASRFNIALEWLLGHEDALSMSSIRQLYSRILGKNLHLLYHSNQ